MSDAEEQLSNEIFTLFPLPVYKTNIGRKLTKQEKDEFDVIISEELMEPLPQDWKQISIDKYLLKRKPLLAIQSFIENHLKEFSTTVLGIDVNEISLDITQSWLNAYNATSFNPVHNHMNSIISWVFYINCLKLPNNKADEIILLNNGHEMFRDIELSIAHPTMFSAKAHSVSVVSGDLVLFPSSVRHSVNVNETTDQIRISLSFNTFMFGVLGKYEETNELILKQGK